MARGLYEEDFGSEWVFEAFARDMMLESCADIGGLLEQDVDMLRDGMTEDDYEEE